MGWQVGGGGGGGVHGWGVGEGGMVTVWDMLGVHNMSASSLLVWVYRSTLLFYFFCSDYYYADHFFLLLRNVACVWVYACVGVCEHQHILLCILTSSFMGPTSVRSTRNASTAGGGVTWMEVAPAGVAPLESLQHVLLQWNGPVQWSLCSSKSPCPQFGRRQPKG